MPKVFNEMDPWYSNPQKKSCCVELMETRVKLSPESVLKRLTKGIVTGLYTNLNF